MAQSDNTLILTPRLEAIEVSVKALQTDLSALRRRVNKDYPLKLSLGADIQQSVGRIKSDLAKLKPQLDNVLKINIGVAGTTAAGTGVSINPTANTTKNVATDTARIKQVNDAYSQLIATLKEYNAVRKQLTALDNTKSPNEAANLNARAKELEATLTRLQNLTVNDPASKGLLNTKQLEGYYARMQKGETDVAAAVARRADAMSRADTSAATSAENTQLQYQGMIAQMDRMKTNWSAFTLDPELANQWDNLRAQMKAAMEAGDASKVKALRSEMNQLSGDIRTAGKAHGTFASMIENTTKRLGAYFSSMLLYTAVIANIRETYQHIKNVDQAMSELRMITDASSSEYASFFKNAADSAGRLGVKINDLIKSTSSFVRLGFSFEDSGQLAEYAQILSTVGQMDIGDATESLVSQMKAFNKPASEALRIIDLLTISDSNLSVTANDVAEGMKRASAALASANNTMEESVAMFNSVFAVLQNAEQSATVLRTVSARLRNTAGSLEELGFESDGAVESLSKLQTQILNLTGGKIDIFLDSETFKSTFQIMDELSRVWGSLSDVAQADLTRLIAGIRNAQGFSALLSNFEDSRKSMELFGTTANDAMNKFDKMSDSMSFKSQQLSAEFQKMVTSVVDSSWLKGLTDLGIELLSLMNIADGLPAKILAITLAFVGFNAVLKSGIFTKIGGAFGGAFTGFLEPAIQWAS